MNIKKRFLAIFLALAMLCSLLPTSVLADDSTTTVKVGTIEELQTEVSNATSDTTILVKQDMTIDSVVSLKNTNCTITIKCADNVTLTLKAKLNLQSSFVLDNVTVVCQDGGYISVANRLSISQSTISADSTSGYAIDTTSASNSSLTIYSGTFTGGSQYTIKNYKGPLNFYPQGNIQVSSIYQTKYSKVSTKNTITIQAQDGYSITSARWNSEDIINELTGGSSKTIQSSAATTYSVSNGYVLDIAVSSGTSGSEPSTEPSPEPSTEPTAAPTYTIKTIRDSNGTVSASSTSAKENDTITVTTTPNDGYELTALTYNDGTNTVDIKESKSFTMPAADVTISATFTKTQYTITTGSDTNGTITVADKATCGESVSIQVNPASGYELSSISVTDANGTAVTVTNNTFTMPASNVTVSATFALSATEAPTFSPAAGTVDKGSTVTISAAEGATIYYTTDGTEPTTSSKVYRDGITINTATTIKAIAVKEGYSNSAVSSAAYGVTTYSVVGTGTYELGSYCIISGADPTSSVVTDPKFVSGSTVYLRVQTLSRSHVELH